MQVKLATVGHVQLGAMLRMGPLPAAAIKHLAVCNFTRCY